MPQQSTGNTLSYGDNLLALLPEYEERAKERQREAAKTTNAMCWGDEGGRWQVMPQGYRASSGASMPSISR